MEHSDSLAKIATALVNVQASVKTALKDSLNPHYKSKYADLGAIWDACRAQLGESGIAVIQMPTAADAGHVGLSTMLLHNSGEWIKDRVTVRCPKDDPQGAGSALTYLRRYALAAALGIVADEDDDAEFASVPSAPPPFRFPAPGNSPAIIPPRATTPSKPPGSGAPTATKAHGF